MVASKAAVASGDLRLGRETLDRVQAVVTSTLSELGLASRVKAGYSGDLVTGMAEYDLVVRDIIDVGGVGIALVLGVLLLFFRTPRALIALGGTIAVGCALTFGFTELAIGHLNIATAFLFSIVAGNGINFGIIWLGRFLEERRAGQPLEVAIAHALDRTYAATLTAAGAAATAYAALGIGSFRGFQHFGVIGASGMALCWLSTYAVMPAITALLERVRLRRHQREGAPGHKVPFTHFEAPFVWVVRRWPGVTLAVTLAAGVAAAVVGGRYPAARRARVQRPQAAQRPRYDQRGVSRVAHLQPHPGGRRLGRHDRADRRRPRHAAGRGGAAPRARPRAGEPAPVPGRAHAG